MNIPTKKNKILLDSSERYCHIYIIKCKKNKKSYIGQAVSHILNHKKYRPYGMNGRFRTHLSEAKSNKKNQCRYLNNAINKYGENNFTVSLLFNCSISDSDHFEKLFIKKYNTLFPNGYNLNEGGCSKIPTLESRRNTSKGVVKYYEELKFERFLKKLKSNINKDFDKYIRPLNRHKIQYGWYIYINGIKADFGGVHIPLKESKQMCYIFLEKLKTKLAKRLVAGSS